MQTSRGLATSIFSRPSYRPPLHDRHRGLRGPPVRLRGPPARTALLHRRGHTGRTSWRSTPCSCLRGSPIAAFLANPTLSPFSFESPPSFPFHSKAYPPFSFESPPSPPFHSKAPSLPLPALPLFIFTPGSSVGTGSPLLAPPELPLLAGWAPVLPRDTALLRRLRLLAEGRQLLRA